MPHDFLPGPDGSGTTDSSGSGSVLPEWLLRLKPLATNPVRWLREHLVIIFLGGVLELVTNISAALFTALVAVAESLVAVGAALAAPFDILGEALVFVAGEVNAAIIMFATAFGPLSPAIVLASYMIVIYVIGIVSIRLIRAIADALPILSGVETFIFG